MDKLEAYPTWGTCNGGDLSAATFTALGRGGEAGVCYSLFARKSFSCGFDSLSRLLRSARNATLPE